VLSLFLFASIFAAAQRSPFTGVAVPSLDTSGHYRLIISGHFHGSSTDRSGYPAATLLANLDRVNALAPAVLISTGDLFMDPDRDSARYTRSLFERLQLPLFNAPGNHDRHGSAYHKASDCPVIIQRGPDRIVVLDTERDDSDITGDQLEVLEKAARDAAAGGVRRLFVISHRPVWAEEDPTYSPLFADNTRSLTTPNFSKEVKPVLDRIAEQAELFWVSGSMAGRAPASIFFQRHAPNITYIQSAIRNELRDALLIADITADSIAWSAMSLTGQRLAHPSTYNAEFWRTAQGEPKAFNWRLLPYLVRTTVLHRSFAYGLAAGVVLVALGFFIFRRATQRRPR